MSEDKSNLTGANSEVSSAIQAFEQILEVMPDDRAALEALSRAYANIGDQQQSISYLIRLANVLIDEQDADAAMALVEVIEPLVGQDARLGDLIFKIEEMQAGQAFQLGNNVSELAKPKEPVASKRKVSFSLSMPDELSCAWNLLQANELSEEEYAQVAQDLSDMSASDPSSTISVLHVLEQRSFASFDKVMAFLAKECGTPIVSVSAFDIQIKPASILPIDFMVRRGVMIFDLMGNEALVVVMNPYNKLLREDIAMLAERKCHFFITMPSDFDHAIAKIIDVLEDGANKTA